MHIFTMLFYNGINTIFYVTIRKSKEEERERSSRLRLQKEKEDSDSKRLDRNRETVLKVIVSKTNISEFLTTGLACFE